MYSNVSRSRALRREPCSPFKSHRLSLKAGLGRIPPWTQSGGVAVVRLGARGQSGGFVWVLVLNGDRIPFETAEFLNDDPFERRTIPHFTTFGTVGYGIRRLGNLRHEFTDDAEQRAAQMLAVEGVLVNQSWRAHMESLSLEIGIPFEELAKRHPPFKGPTFQFEGRVYMLDDFGYGDWESEPMHGAKSSLVQPPNPGAAR